LELFTGEPIDEDELDDLMDEFDEDESGEIEFSEFIELAEYFVEPEPDPKELQKDLREVFVLYDKQKKGYIPAEDFKGILKQLGPEVPEEELDGIVGEIDQDSSGTIDFSGKSILRKP
jgi:calmodulin